MNTSQKQESNRKYNDKRMFNGNRELAILRDNEKCTVCEMSRSEHKKLYNLDLDVHHIDGKGSNVPVGEKNNDLDNLQTVCRQCHIRIDFHKRHRTPIAAYDLNGNLIKVFEGAQQACDELKVNIANVIECANGRRYYRTVGGYRWKFVEDGNLSYEIKEKCAQCHKPRELTQRKYCVACALQRNAYKVGVGYYKQYYQKNKERILTRIKNKSKERRTYDRRLERRGVQTDCGR